MGRAFAHASIRLTGSVDATGGKVDTDPGFTVMSQIGPSVLFEPVKGKVFSQSADYIAKGQRHFWPRDSKRAAAYDHSAGIRPTFGASATGCQPQRAMTSLLSLASRPSASDQVM